MGFTIDGPKHPQDQRSALLLPPLAVLLGAVFLTFRVIFAVATVEGGSMEPTLYPWDYLLVTQSYDTPRRGDIISISAETKGSKPLIKRVIAVAGDTVQVANERATVNGAPEPWPVAAVPSDYALPPTRVPPDAVWVMGDNRDNSLDSRSFGFVPLRAVLGRAFAVYWPPSHARFLDASGGSH